MQSITNSNLTLVPSSTSSAASLEATSKMEREPTSFYHGSGNPSPLLNLPVDVLRIIATKLAEQNATLPLRFVCKKLRELNVVKKATTKIQDATAYALNLHSPALAVWLHDNLRYPRTEASCEAAAEHGNLPHLMWLREQGCPWNVITCAAAAKGGHLALLQWARANGCSWNEWTCTAAAEGGHLEALQWARANGCPWTDRTCAYAASGGHLEVLQWARANGCPWDELTCTAAAANGYLGVLQWARANGCPWNESTCKNAAHRGHLTILQWARANGCPWDEKTWSYADATVRPWLLENGCPGAN